ncbi:MAG: L,D-transpeptidase [Synergistaceae bacterium]|jgi:lipoprotein-anchoring transpeptidase ErfK/SrfK|nr:L,D-transpeptidase [Synergistaceae bacterium]
MNFNYTPKWQKLRPKNLPFKVSPVVACILFVVAVSLFIVYYDGTEDVVEPVAMGESGKKESAAQVVEIVVPDAVEVLEVVEDTVSEDVVLDEIVLGGPKREGIQVLIEKDTHRLTVLRNGKKVREYGVAVGKNRGNKQRVGDMRTPEGVFHVQQIQDASNWAHDFRDGRGLIANAYGPLFIRLKTPGWIGIGIHGTHDPKSIGTDATEGCIRLNNSDLLELRKLIAVGTNVFIK